MAGSLKLLGGMIPDPDLDSRLELARHAHTSVGDPESFPEVAEHARLVVEITSRASLGALYPGWVTSGASEGNLLALMALRSLGASRVVALDTAHYSVYKSAAILGMKLEVVDTRNGVPDFGMLRRSLKGGEVVVATVGTTQEGVVDNVLELGEIASRVGSWVHVDAAYAGYVARFLTPKARFRLDGTVATMVVDAHKIPEAPPPAGVILAYSYDLLDRLWFEAPYLPGGKQFGVLGTRPGGPIVAAAKRLSRMESIGFDRIATTLMSRLESLVERAESMGFSTPVKPEVPVTCLAHRNMHAIVNRLKALGYMFYKCPRYNGLRVVMLPSVKPARYLAALKRATATL